MDRVNMSEDQLLEALRLVTSQPNESGTFSVQDVCDRTGVGTRRARDMVRALILAGRVEVVNVMSRNLVGVVMPRPRYRLIVSPD